MDGLLIDSERHIMQAWLDSARDLGHALSASDFTQVIGRAGPESQALLTRLLGSEAAFRATAEQAEARLRGDRSHAVFPLKAGAAELLAALATAGVPCAVASSSAVHEIHQRLAHVGILDCFRAIAGGDEVVRGKPDPAIYRLAAARLEVAPAACLAFEDSENGARAAQAAGIPVIVVPDLRLPAPEVLARAHGVLDSLEEAIPKVPHWFARA